MEFASFKCIVCKTDIAMRLSYQKAKRNFPFSNPFFKAISFENNT